jgi:hypothetical protein
MPAHLNRRDALGLAAATGAAFLLDTAGQAGEKPPPQRYRVPYIRKDVPAVEPPEYAGQRYEARVPDTLDLQDRAALAVNGLTGPLDPDKDWMLYFNVDFRTNPPVMWHRGSDICVTKFEEALPLMRLVSGSSLNGQVDRVWMSNALRQIGPDGLVYWPANRGNDDLPAARSGRPLGCRDSQDR